MEKVDSATRCGFFCDNCFSRSSFTFSFTDFWILGTRIIPWKLYLILANEFWSHTENWKNKFSEIWLIIISYFLKRNNKNDFAILGWNLVNKFLVVLFMWCVFLQTSFSFYLIHKNFSIFQLFTSPKLKLFFKGFYTFLLHKNYS